MILKKPLLRVDELETSYVTPFGCLGAVKKVSFELFAGEVLGLCGESGGGKSSVVLSIMRLLPSNGRIIGGKVSFDGVDLLNLDEETFRREYRWRARQRL